MANEILKRDENFRTVVAGVSNDADQDVLMFRVDPITNYLLVNITDTGATSATESQIASRDGNHRPVCLAWNEQDQELQEVLTDTDGNLLCDVEFV
jgi:hypothetical protein